MIGTVVGDVINRDSSNSDSSNIDSSISDNSNSDSSNSDSRNSDGINSDGSNRDRSNSNSSNSDIFKLKQLDTLTTDAMFEGQRFAMLAMFFVFFYMRQVTSEPLCGMNILSIFQLSSFSGLGWTFKIF